MPAVRPLPPRPSLEYERKEAKALLRRLRAGDPDALARARARHPGLDPAAPERARLADAQLVVAREYGFASWPRLVRYFDEAERQRHALRQLGGRALYEAQARDLPAAHRARRAWAGRALAAYVPRFYGMALDDVFATAVTEDDARLAVARSQGAPSWEVLLERVGATSRTQPGAWEQDPIREAAAAIEASDRAALERVVAAYPALLQPSEYDRATGHNLMWLALGQERRRGPAAMGPVMAWLADRGFDRRRELHTRLLGHVGMTAEEVRTLLDLGADPNAPAPNGAPVLEHALLRYWNGDAVDVLAAHAAPPRAALWTAAGLGDVDGVARCLDRRGRPTAAARRSRPDFVAAGLRGFVPPLPDADDEELLLEALLVATLNGRRAVIEYLAARGAPLNSLIFGEPLVQVAAGNGMAHAVEALARGGADLDLSGDSNGSARQLARALLEERPDDAVRRRIVALCGMDPDAILAERDARPRPAPQVDRSLQRALALAGDDAARLGQPDVRPENLLVGLLRDGGPALYVLNEVGRMDVRRLRADLADRVAPAEEVPLRPAPPMGAGGQAAIEAAFALAVERRQDTVWALHLLHALLAPDGPATQLLTRYGVDPVAVRAAVGQTL